jgi:hypothetical protein
VFPALVRRWPVRTSPTFPRTIHDILSPAAACGVLNGAACCFWREACESLGDSGVLVHGVRSAFPILGPVASGIPPAGAALSPFSQREESVAASST